MKFQITVSTRPAEMGEGLLGRQTAVWLGLGQPDGSSGRSDNEVTEASNSGIRLMHQADFES